MIRSLRHQARPNNARLSTLCVPALGAVVACCLIAVCLTAGCARSGPVSSTLGDASARPRPTQSRIDAGAGVGARRIELPKIKSIKREPVVRVRVQRGALRARLSSDDVLLIGPIARARQQGSARQFTDAVSITHHRGAFMITDSRQQTVRWAIPLMRVVSSTGSPVIFNGRTYPGAIVLVPINHPQGRATGKMDVVNHVLMESYLPGVIECELYSSWAPQTFRAAAIAARSYAVFESSLNRLKHYDLESTVASQAYGGQSRNPKALGAVEQTRGQLLAYRNRIVPAFYSSACGGLSQDAKAAFTWLRGMPDIPPIRGRSHGAWCKDSDKYRWGPIIITKVALTQRFSQWGRIKGHPIKKLRAIRDIRVHTVNRVGRPTAFSVSDIAGMTYILGPEQFRFACNFRAPGLGNPGKGQTLYSSHVRIKTDTLAVTFYDGRGFGHGVGLCQFGAQGLAKKGYSAYSILHFYYPQSEIVQAY